MKLRHSVLLSLFALLLAACSGSGLNQITWVTAGQHNLSGITRGDLIVLDGEIVLPEDSRLEGSLHLLAGKVFVRGEILGDVSFLGGELALEPGAHLLGRLTLGSGSASISPRARVDGEVSRGLPVQSRNSSSTGWGWWLRALSGGALLGLLAIFLEQFAPHAACRVAVAALNHCLVSGSLGLLVGVAGLSLLVTIAYTILLIPVSLLGLLILGIAVAYGWASLGVMLGRHSQHLLKRQAPAGAAAFAGGLAFFLLLEGLSSIPWIGSLIGISAALVGLGSVFLTRFGLSRFEPAALTAEDGG